MWLRRSLGNLAYILPWPALRLFKTSVDTMHPICAQVFYEKKEAFDEGGIAALTNTASGGRDLTTLLSQSRLCTVLPNIELLTIVTSSVQANAEADEEDRMPDEIVIANMRFVSRSNLRIYSDGVRSPVPSFWEVKKRLLALCHDFWI